MLVAAGLMMLGKADTLVMERFRGALTDAFVPILDVLSRPADAVSRAIDTVREWVLLREDNERLRHERDRLLRWQAVALRLEAENAELRRLLQFVPEPEARYVTGRVVADASGTFAHSLVLNAGAADGIVKGDAVVTGEGLVGRVVGVAHRSARVLLITDLNSRIPVAVSTARTRAILAGTNTRRPELVHVESEATILPGDRVVTSGDAGALPPGLPVGVVAAVADGHITVAPYMDRHRLEYVRVVDYGLRERGVGRSGGETAVDGTAAPAAAGGVAPRSAAP